MSQAVQGGSLSVDESPTQRVRSLREIYKSCAFALNVSNPKTFEEEE